MTGAELRAIRLAHGLSMRTMAETLGVSAASICLMEQARRPSSKPIEKLVKIFFRTTPESRKDVLTE